MSNPSPASCISGCFITNQCVVITGVNAATLKVISTSVITVIIMPTLRFISRETSVAITSTAPKKCRFWGARSVF